MTMATDAFRDLVEKCLDSRPFFSLLSENVCLFRKTLFAILKLRVGSILRVLFFTREHIHLLSEVLFPLPDRRLNSRPFFALPG